MYRAEIDRNELKIHFKDRSDAIPLDKPIVTENIDLMPAVKLLWQLYKKLPYALKAW
jgi:hypothetical protein